MPAEILTNILSLASGHARYNYELFTGAHYIEFPADEQIDLRDFIYNRNSMNMSYRQISKHICEVFDEHFGRKHTPLTLYLTVWCNGDPIHPEEAHAKALPDIPLEWFVPERRTPSSRPLNHMMCAAVTMLVAGALEVVDAAPAQGLHLDVDLATNVAREMREQEFGRWRLLDRLSRQCTRSWRGEVVPFIRNAIYCLRREKTVRVCVKIWGGLMDTDMTDLAALVKDLRYLADNGLLVVYLELGVNGKEKVDIWDSYVRRFCGSVVLTVENREELFRV